MQKTSASESEKSLSAELDRAREREAATREILEVISQSRDDETPVFDAVLRSAIRLCGADTAALLLGRPDDARLTLAALCNKDAPSTDADAAIIAAINATDMVMDPSLHVSARTICSGAVMHVRDVAQLDSYLSGEPTFRVMVEDQGVRTLLSVPLFDARGALGAINLHRREVRLFSEDEIALIQSFAAQAVIAIENVRQFRELQTRLEREAATREILEVISQSQEDDAPVFDVILSNAARLCNAPMAGLMLTNEAQSEVVLAGYHGLTLRALNLGDTWELFTEPDMMTEFGRAILEARTTQEADLALTPQYLQGEASLRQLVDEEGLRSRMSVPLVRGGKGIGAIILSRREVAPFGAEDIALIDTFAAQAVIAIENVRQFRELQTRLEREAATREILTVISQSRDDDAPVFDVVLRKSADLCGASMADLEIISEDRSHAVMVAHWGETLRHHVVGASAWPMDSELANAIYMHGGRIVHVHDMADTDLYRAGDPNRVADVDKEGIRTFLAVPLFSGGRTIGCIALYRREVKPFTDDEIALVETFAAQAVIAIENVRQFRELQTRLAREAATREILEVISQSRDDETPVFDVILKRAADLCNSPAAALAMGKAGDTHQRLAAQFGLSHSTVALYDRGGVPMNPDISQVAQSILTGKAIHIADILDSEGYRRGVEVFVSYFEETGARTELYVPLVAAEGGIGAFIIFRTELRPYTADEIALVETFAAQAVIAIENVRQFRELQTRLAREAATREILSVISQSRDNEQPVFEVVLRKSAHLCGASMASLNIVSEDRSQVVKMAEWGDQTSDQLPAGTTVWQIDSGNAPAVCVREGRIVHLHDMADTDLYRSGDAKRVAAVDDLGIRTFLAVPLFSGGQTVGCISVYRHAVKPFATDEIAILETFAAQAVIAIENVRQFKALEALNAELGQRVEAQVGEIERMGRLKRFLPVAVADAVVTSGSEKMLSSHRALLGVLFCDIRGFTAFCETAEPEETIEVLQTYHEEMGKLINAHGAGVDHRMGDGIMVLFNDPLPCADPAGDAVRLAMAMRARMAELCVGWKRLGHRLGFGLGVSLGYATVGMVGFEGRFDYTASGTAINLASRLCDDAQDGEILISPRTRMAVEGDFQVESRGEITFKGIREPVEVFCVTGVAT